MKFSKKRILPLILSAFAVIFIVLPFAYLIYSYTVCHEVLMSVKDYNPSQATKIFDINDELISELFEENRSIVPASDLSLEVIQAFIAAEDKGFYRHGGIDLIGIFRAMIIDFASGEIKQGGSTITQQLAKQLYTKGEKSFERKMAELFLARELEKKFSKDKILEMYLNQIFFGHGAYGIDSASRFFFRKPANELNVIEAALLAAIPSAPDRFSPLKNPRSAFLRHRQILLNMVSAGFIDRERVSSEFTVFWEAFLRRNRTRYPSLGIRSKRFDRAPHFTEYIRRQLVGIYGEKSIYKEGYRIYTTLDLSQQKAAHKAIMDGIDKQRKFNFNDEGFTLRNSEYKSIFEKTSSIKLKKDEAGFYYKIFKKLNDDAFSELDMISMVFGLSSIDSLLVPSMEFIGKKAKSSQIEGSLIALDTSTGGITAMMGGSDFNSSNQLNRAVQTFRQPGSAFKAFIYGAAIESRKITAGTPFLDAPIVFKGTKTTWKPNNYERSYQGKVLVRKALAVSLNIVSVLIMEAVGDKEVAAFASKLTGVPIARFKIDPTLAMGTTELSPLEICRGFAVYANGGHNILPHSIRHVLDNSGKKIYSSRPDKSGRLVSEETSYIMTSLLRSVVDSGTATNAIRNTADFNLPCAGKTGTNTNFRDAWFVGYTPDLAASVWVGCDSPKYSLGPGQSAANVAAPIWGNFMKGVYQNKKTARFRDKPKAVVNMNICSKTGKLPVDGCVIKNEIFIDGTGPSEKCDLDHGEMISVFDLVKKKKDTLLDKERAKMLIERDEPEGR
jgi:penicillin-binding protein 1A